MVILAPSTFDDSSASPDLLKAFALFPFPLSPFQKHSIQAIREGRSVLITAHTGSGKTLPAEYAIQHFCSASGTRRKVVYCSPIKALSNQKFYEFQQKYPHISFGLMTGDNKINAAADCLIMTTEILMNALFRGNAAYGRSEAAYGRENAAKPVSANLTEGMLPSASSFLCPSGPHEPLPVGLSENGFESVPETALPNVDGLQRSNLLEFSLDIDTELAAVVLDEVHYINDAGRGHVWEQLIMLLPAHVQLIMLSATIDRPEEFAAWCQGPEGRLPLATGGTREGRRPEHCIDALPNLSDNPSLKPFHETVKHTDSDNPSVIPLSETVKQPDSDNPSLKPFPETVKHTDSDNPSLKPFHETVKHTDSDNPSLKPLSNALKQPDSVQRREVVLSSTSHRIVPLSHHVFLTHTEGHIKKTKDDGAKAFLRKNTNTLLTIQTATGKWQPETYTTMQKVLDTLDRADRATGARMSPVASGRGQKASSAPPLSAKYVLNKLLAHLVEKEMVPALLFLFSRKQVEKVAADVMTTVLPFDSKVPYIARREVEKVLRDKLDNWQEYVALPEYEFLVGLLEKGIGIHHAGMVPVFREIVELFISRRYIYLLIATESFAIGLDCPIKTTIFMGLSKWDGKANRLLMSHEYTQMAGRAGRRGIDTVGYVVHLPNLYALPSAMDYQAMLSGRPERFESKFAVSYGVVLALLQQGPKTVVEMVRFAEGSMAGNKFRQQIEAQQRRTREAWELKEAAWDGLERVPEARAYLERQSWMGGAKRRGPEPDAELKEAVRRLDVALQCESQAKEEQRFLEALQGWIGGQVEMVGSVLVELGFAERGDEGAFALTRAGNIAAGIKEVDGLVLTPVLLATDGLQGWSVEQVVGLLAFFLEVRDGNMYSSPTGDYGADIDDPVLAKAFRRLMEAKEAKEAAEIARPDLDRGEETVLQTRLSPALIEWCAGCHTGETCRALLQTEVAEQGVSLGDFVKAVLKVVAAKKELEVVATMEGWVHTQHLLAQVEERMLKFIMTNQSLYL